MAELSLLSRDVATAATQKFFDVVQAALAETLGTLCQDQAQVGTYELFASPDDIAQALAGSNIACIQAPVRDQADQKVHLFVPILDALSLTGLSMFETSDEIEARRASEAVNEDDQDGLESLADQTLSAVATKVRSDFETPFALETPTAECREMTPEEVTALLPAGTAVARLVLTIEPYDSSALFFAAPESLIDALAAEPEPAPAAPPKPAAAAPQPAPAAPAPSGPIVMDDTIERILKIPVPVIVLLAETIATTEEVLQISEGTVIQFSKSDEEPLDFLVNNKTIGRGVVVKIGKKLGLQIQEIGDPKEIIKKL